MTTLAVAMLVVLYLFGVGGFTGILRRIAKEFTFDEAVTAAIFWPVAALFVAASPVLLGLYITGALDD